jgi:hypothetical protein
MYRKVGPLGGHKYTFARSPFPRSIYHFQRSAHSNVLKMEAVYQTTQGHTQKTAMFWASLIAYTGIVDTTSDMGISSIKTIGVGMCLTCLI